MRDNRCGHDRRRRAACTSRPLRSAPRARRVRRRLRRATSKGTAVARLSRQALQILMQPEHRGACGCEANTGDGAGILLQVPDTVLPQGAALRAARRGRIWRRHRVPAARTRPTAPPPSTCSNGSSREEGQHLLGWRDVPTDDRARRPERGRRRTVRPAGLRRPRPAWTGPMRASVRTQAVRHPASGSRTRVDAGLPRRGAESTSVACPATTLVYKGHADRRSSIAVCSPTCTIPTSKRPCARPPALQHEHVSQSGRSRIRTATSPTTARSTRCAATSTGCAPAKALLASPTSSATTSEVLPVIAKAAATRRCSTTSWKCWS